MIEPRFGKKIDVVTFTEQFKTEAKQIKAVEG